MILEFCAENYTLIPEAISKGAGRIELCDNLSQGGTTPFYGVSRILTHGGPKSRGIADNVERLLQLNHYAQNRGIILPGGGIRHDNLASLHAQLQFQEYHGTKIVPAN